MQASDRSRTAQRRASHRERCAGATRPRAACRAGWRMPSRWQTPHDGSARYARRVSRHVRVRHLRDHLDLSEKAIRRQLRREFRKQDPDRDMPVVSEIPLQVHRRHASMAQLPDQLVATGQAVVHCVQRARHHAAIRLSGSSMLTLRARTVQHRAEHLARWRRLAL